jgi:hypothetical protein
MFHAVGLNVMDARESKRDIVEVSRRALRDMIAKVVVEERPAKTWRGISHGPRIHGVTGRMVCIFSKWP